MKNYERIWQIKKMKFLPKEQTWLSVCLIMTIWQVIAAWEPNTWTAGFSLKLFIVNDNKVNNLWQKKEKCNNKLLE